MSITRKSLVVLATAIVAGAAFAVGCSDDATDSGSSGSSGSRVDAGGAGDVDAGDVDAGVDAGEKKANGEACTTESDTSTECASGVCKTLGGGSGGGGGGNAARTRCTVKCDNPQSNDDPKCAGGSPFSGRCNNQGYCQLE